MATALTFAAVVDTVNSARNRNRARALRGDRWEELPPYQRMEEPQAPPPPFVETVAFDAGLPPNHNNEAPIARTPYNQAISGLSIPSIFLTNHLV